MSRKNNKAKQLKQRTFEKEREAEQKAKNEEKRLRKLKNQEAVSA